MTEEELEEIVVNFIYLGKIHTGLTLQKKGNRVNNLIKGEQDEDITEEPEEGIDQGSIED